MTIGGWIFMLVSWGVILGLFIFSMVRTLGGGSEEEAKEQQSSK